MKNKKKESYLDKIYKSEKKNVRPLKNIKNSK